MAAFWYCQACSNCFANFCNAATSAVASMTRDIFSSSNCWAVVKLRAGVTEPMDVAQMPQFEHPYITVRTDAQGGACWAVVGLGKVVQCYCGHQAIAELQSMATATGLPTPS